MGIFHSSKGNSCDTRLQGGDGDVPASAEPFPSLTLLLDLNLKVNEQSSPIDPGWADERHALRRARPPAPAPSLPFFFLPPLHALPKPSVRAQHPGPPTLLGARGTTYRSLQRAVPLSDGLLPAATATSALPVSLASACQRLGGAGRHGTRQRGWCPSCQEPRLSQAVTLSAEPCAGSPGLRALLSSRGQNTT